MADSTPPEVVDRTCHFLELSGELRNRIYRYAVVETSPVCVLKPIEPENRESTGLEPPPSEPALASTNKQIREEVLGIYWSENIFDVAHVFRCIDADSKAGFTPKSACQGILDWMTLLPLNRLRLLRHLMATISTEKNGTIIASASLDRKTCLLDLKVQRHDHGQVVKLCACSSRAADPNNLQNKLEGYHLILVTQHTIQHYFDSEIQKYAAEDGTYEDQHCEKCSCLATELDWESYLSFRTDYY